MPSAASDIYGESKVLITGGTGSIGVELLDEVLKRGARKVRVLTNDENGLFETSNMYENDPRIEFRLGDVRDTRSLEGAMSGCNIVFHAAALKHVQFCETDPYEAITTNILGTQKVIDECVRQSISRFVLISTDKAVNPESTMGATKLLAEKLVINASKLSRRTVFSTVRFGNVIGSRGSVTVIFEEQVKRGGPITVTDPSMTRFIMAPSDASRLILQAAEESLPGEIFVLRMKAVRIGDLAEACRDYFSKKFGKDPSSIKSRVIGASPGEKKHEELMNYSESMRCIDFGRFYIINPNEERKGPRQVPGHTKPLSSGSVPPLSAKEIMNELDRLYESN